MGSQIGEAILLAGKPAVQIQTLDGAHKYYRVTAKGGARLVYTLDRWD